MSYDVIIIGAGINGAGIARDAAMRGLKVLLIDKGDIGSGTTSWSTRLIHGGLRYLEYGELGLVRESLREREILLKIAPHLVRPLPILIPLYKNNRRGPWTLRAGMLAYDILSYDKSLESHRFLSRHETLLKTPGLDPHGLVGSALYFDAQIEFPERLTVENVIDARENGAEVRTYTESKRILDDQARVRGVETEDVLTGEKNTFFADVIVNVAGPWVDSVIAGSVQHNGKLIGGTKGSHIVVRPFPGAPDNAIYAETQRDHRPFFIIPWNSLYLIGTTDVRFEGPPETAVATEAEIDYLLAEAVRLIPESGLDRESVLYSYSGVRPLPASGEGDPGGITRRHFIHKHALHGLFSVIGGKLTTYRSLSEQAVDTVFKSLGRSVPACATGVTPLPGMAEQPPGLANIAPGPRRSVTNITLDHLQRVYGGRASRVLDLVSDDPTLGDTLEESTGAIAAEIVFGFESEMARTLSDVIMRRSMIGLAGRLSTRIADQSASVAVRKLGWSTARAADEICSFESFISRLKPWFPKQ
jgi:glycerol-3-phosphate dehydrogenase